MLLKNMVAIITHPTEAIGRCIAMALALEGARVVASGAESSPAILQTLADEIRAHGGGFLAVQGDLAHADGMAEVLRTFGRIDILVNIVRIAHPATAEAISDVAQDELLRVNLTDAIGCARAALPHMKAQRAGAILNVSSGSGGFGRIGVLLEVSRETLHALTKSLAIEGAPHGVRVNAVMVGPVQTETSEAILSKERRRILESVIPLGRLGRPEDLAGAAVFLCSSLASFITGEVVGVDGGWSLGRPMPLPVEVGPPVRDNRGK